MSEHSNIMGGSTAAQRINCPGSYQLELEQPKGPPSEFADRGSMLHAAMELLVTADPESIKDAEPLFAEMIGQDFGFEGHEVTQELVDTKLRPALDAWFAVLDEYDLEDWFIEQRVSLETVVKGAFGTTDILAKDTKKRLHVLDWKFGDGVVVPVKGNYGLGFYAGAALYDEDEELIEFCDDITGVVLHIVQPRVGSEQALYTWETTEQWIEALVDQAGEAMQKAMSEKPPLKTGPWCRWCAAKPVCPAQNNLASEALGKQPESMSGIELAEALKKADILKSWIASVYDLAQRELESGAAVPGYKLVQKQPRRQWVDATAAEKAMRKAKIKVGDMFKKSLISPTQLQELNKEVYSSLQSDHVIMHSSGLTVVDDSDKREAVTSSMDLLANALPDEKQAKAKRKRNRSKKK